MITTASMIPEEVGEKYMEVFKNLNVPSVGIMLIKEEADANNPEFLERLRQAQAILISGEHLKLQLIITHILPKGAILEPGGSETVLIK